MSSLITLNVSGNFRIKKRMGGWCSWPWCPYMTLQSDLTLLTAMLMQDVQISDVAFVCQFVHSCVDVLSNQSKRILTARHTNQSARQPSRSFHHYYPWNIYLWSCFRRWRFDDSEKWPQSFWAKVLLELFRKSIDVSDFCCLSLMEEFGASASQSILIFHVIKTRVFSGNCWKVCSVPNL